LGPIGKASPYLRKEGKRKKERKEEGNRRGKKEYIIMKEQFFK
jgi:hypothetical protein